MQARQSRKEKALVTRRRMLEAAYHLFCEQGYSTTTMDAIALEADVAVQTLYFTFHTKGAILGEVLGAAIIGFDRWRGPPKGPIDAGDSETLREFHAWFAAFEAERDAGRALAQLVDSSVESMRRGAPLVRIIFAAWGDPDARAVYELGERRRVETFRALVRALAAKKGGLKKGLTIPRATDILLTLFSAPTYSALAARGWTHPQVRRWLIDVLSQQLLA